MIVEKKFYSHYLIFSLPCLNR